MGTESKQYKAHSCAIKYAAFPMEYSTKRNVQRKRINALTLYRIYSVFLHAGSRPSDAEKAGHCLLLILTWKSTEATRKTTNVATCSASPAITIFSPAIASFSCIVPIIL